MSLDKNGVSPYLSDEELQVFQNQQQSTTKSYDEMYKELYGNGYDTNMPQGQMNNGMGYAQQVPNIPPIQNSPMGTPYGGIDYTQAAAFNQIAPNQNVVIDNVANLKYVQNGYNNVSPHSSQYGLCDVDAGDWFKFNMVLLVPIFNFLFCFYYSCLKTFIKYPVIKEWTKSAMVTSLVIDMLYFLLIFALI